LDVMQQIGCDAGQGYLFQRPATPEDFITFLRAWPLQSIKLGFGVKGDLPLADLTNGI
jgi:hypothetical protein